MRFSLITTAAALAMTAPAFAQSTQAEIEAALVGNTFQGGMGGGAYASYFGEDGMYSDESGSGEYTITDEGVCYPGTDFGCYQADIAGDRLEWSQNGESQGAGSIVSGNPMGFGLENGG